MKTNVWATLGVAVLGVAGGYGLYQLGHQRGLQAAGSSAASMPGMQPASAAGAAPADALPQSVAEGEAATRRHLQAGLKAGDLDPQTGHRILYYHDPMSPGQRFDRPGKSPFMDMMLVPVYDAATGDAGQVSISPRVQQNLGLRTAEVVEGELTPQVSAIGSIAFNERDQAVVQARTTAYVERVHVRAALDPVRAGQPLLDLYVPDWVAAQEEFLAVRRMQGTDLAALTDGARQRMRQVGMSEEQIRRVESSGRPQPRITLSAPIGGVLVELAAREGMTVTAGAPLFRINGLASVWAQAEVPESQAAGLRPGLKVQARSPALPGQVFEGRVQALLPELSPATRTRRVRLEIANPDLRLVPGMTVTMNLSAPRAGKALLVPSEAVIQTGQRTLVMLAEEDGRFRPVVVQAGVESGGQTEIQSGLHAGQRVVVSAQFLIDSEASLRGLEARTP